MPKRPRIQRSTLEMETALRNHTRLLGEYLQRAYRDGDDAYLGEVAGKLRLLAARTRTNKPLLLEVAARYGRELKFVLDGPPGMPLGGGPRRGGDTVTLAEYMQMLAIAVRLGDEPGAELVQLSNERLVLAWAQQVGASHEDWSVDEELAAAFDFPAFDFPMHVFRLPIATIALRAIGLTVLREAEEFLADPYPPLPGPAHFR